MKFMAWPEIEGFHNIRKFIRVDPNEWFRAKEQLNGTSTVHYKAKVKLHGTNAAVRIDSKGEVTAQSRTNIITPESDNAGFARWVKANEAEFRKCAGVPSLSDEDPVNAPSSYLNMVFFGEWIGPGIQKGVAVSDIPKKCFAVFAMRINPDLPDHEAFFVDPKHIALYLGKSGHKFFPHIDINLPDVYILPWYEKEIDINWRQSDEELTKATAEINDWVLEIEKNDPWVEATFGVKGTGEGLVFYPTSDAHKNNFEMFQNLCFKAKGEKHKNIATAKPAQVNPEAAASIEAFVALVLTPARLEQGAKAVGGSMINYQNNLVQGGPEVPLFDQKNTGKFVAWCLSDVEKETQDELEASKLTFKDVQKALSDKARTWYLTEARK